MAKAVKASGRSLSVGHTHLLRPPWTRPETAAIILAFLRGRRRRLRDANLHLCKAHARRPWREGGTMPPDQQRAGPESDMSRKAWFAATLAAAAVGAAWLFSPKLGGLAVIVVALCAVGLFAHRLL
jgi:hypothetical protein